MAYPLHVFSSNVLVEYACSRQNIPPSTTLPSLQFPGLLGLGAGFLSFSGPLGLILSLFPTAFLAGPPVGAGVPDSERASPGTMLAGERVSAFFSC